MSLFDDYTVIENVMIALPEFRARRQAMFASAFANPAMIDVAGEILEQVGLQDQAWEPCTRLSYGDRRALEIGIALAARPAHPVPGRAYFRVGRRGDATAGRLIQHLRQRYTIVMIEHDMRFLFDLADRISVIHWGQVIAEGTPSELGQNKWVQRSALAELA